MPTSTTDVRIWYYWVGHLPLLSQAKIIIESGAKCYWVKRQKTPRFASRLNNILSPTRQYLDYACGQPELRMRSSTRIRPLEYGRTNGVPLLDEYSGGQGWVLDFTGYSTQPHQLEYSAGLACLLVLTGTSRWPDTDDRSIGIYWLFAQWLLNTVYQIYNWYMIDMCQSGMKNKK